jgi:hypothetical protein
MPATQDYTINKILMDSKNPITWPLRDALKTAQAMLDMQIGPIEGSIALASYAHHALRVSRISQFFTP